MSSSIGRPRGEVRQALLAAASEYQSRGEAFTWKDLARCACVGRQAAKATCRAMINAGELVQAGYVHGRGSNRPMVLLRMAKADAIKPDHGDDLLAALRMWHVNK